MNRMELECGIINKLRARIPFNAEISQLHLLRHWDLLESGKPHPAGFPMPIPEEVLNAASAFIEAGFPQEALRAAEMLPEENAYKLDRQLLTMFAEPEHVPKGGIKMLIATNIADLSPEANQRQRLCLEHNLALAKDDGDLELINLSYPEEFLNQGLVQEFPLQRSSLDFLTPPTPKLPLMTELFDLAAEHAQQRGYDYFGFINSDILLTQPCLAFARTLLEHGFENLAFTRTDIPDMEALNNPKRRLGLHLSGTDLFICPTGWWSAYRHMFEDYLIGSYWWDCVFVGIMMVHSRCYYAGQQRGLIYHLEHNTRPSGQSPRADYNLSLRTGKDSFYFDIHTRYCDLLRAYMARHRCLPSVKTNLDLIEDKFLCELKKNLRNVKVDS